MRPSSATKVAEHWAYYTAVLWLIAQVAGEETGADFTLAEEGVGERILFGEDGAVLVEVVLPRPRVHPEAQGLVANELRRAHRLGDPLFLWLSGDKFVF